MLVPHVWDEPLTCVNDTDLVNRPAEVCCITLMAPPLDETMHLRHHKYHALYTPQSFQIAVEQKVVVFLQKIYDYKDTIFSDRNAICFEFFSKVYSFLWMQQFI